MNVFLEYLNNAIEAAQKKEQELIATERKDEANLQKIRANIYGICLTVVRVVAKEKNGEELWKDYIFMILEIFFPPMTSNKCGG